MDRRHARGIGAVLRTALGLFVLMLVASAACGRDPMEIVWDGDGGGPGGSSSGAGPDPDGGSGSFFPSPDGSSLPTGALTITPTDPVITVVTGTAAPTVQFAAQVGG